MNGLGIVGLARCVAVWAATSVAVVGVILWTLPDLPGPGTPGAASFDRLLVRGCALAVAGCALWWWLVTTIVVTSAVHRLGVARPRSVVPPSARRWVLAACGLAVVAGGLSPAQATPGPLHQDDRALDGLSLDGLPLPERPTGGLPRAPLPSGEHVTVRPGDSLWRIAAASLRPGAGDVAVTVRWQGIYQRNRHVIGADPDLIRPGQRLLTPGNTPPRGET